jgi:acetoacetyl-CoA synthetase
MTATPKLLWEPPAELQANCTMRTFMRWLAQRYGLHFEDYHTLYRWSVDEIETFLGGIVGILSDQSLHPVYVSSIES